MLERLTVPTPAISLSEIKDSLGVAGHDHDQMINDLIGAATNVLRRWTGRELTTTRYRLSLSGFPCYIDLPFPPLASVESITYYDTAGVDEVMDAADYQVCKYLEVPSQIVPAPNTVWPTTQNDRIDAVQVEFLAGTSTAPPEARHFIRMLVRHWYDNPSAVTSGVMTKEVEFSLRSLAASLGTGFYADV